MSTPAAFISYSREDSEFVLRLAQDLKAAGASVWLDQLDLKPGSSWDNSIEDALLAAPQMLVILSPVSVKSENVRDEISYALRLGKTVVPVLYMDCIIPLRLERKQHIDFRSDYTQGLASLLDQLRVDHPNQAVLAKAAEDEAKRNAAWQARENHQSKLVEQPIRPVATKLAEPSQSGGHQNFTQTAAKTKSDGQSSIRAVLIALAAIFGIVWIIVVGNSGGQFLSPVCIVFLIPTVIFAVLAFRSSR